MTISRTKGSNSTATVNVEDARSVHANTFIDLLIDASSAEARSEDAADKWFERVHCGYGLVHLP